LMFRLSFKMLQTDSNEIPNMSETWQVVILLFLGKHSFTQSTFSSVLLVNGHGEWPASTEVTLLLNLKNYSRACVSPIVCSQNTSFSAMKVPIRFFPSLKQTLMQKHYSFKSAFSRCIKITNGTTHTLT
jgi:hypothetical protein